MNSSERSIARVVNERLQAFDERLALFPEEWFKRAGIFERKTYVVLIHTLRMYEHVSSVLRDLREFRFNHATREIRVRGGHLILFLRPEQVFDLQVWHIGGFIVLTGATYENPKFYQAIGHLVARINNETTS